MDCVICHERLTNSPHRLAHMGKFFSDLDLTGDAPVRVRPRLGEWGPLEVPTTTRKKRARIVVSVVFVVAGTAVGLLMWFFYRALQGYFS